MPKGKKICPECGIESGVRTSACKCGHRFSKKSDQTNVEKSEQTKSVSTPITKIDCESDNFRPQLSRFYSSISNPLIQTPAGRCRIKPEGFSKKDWPDGPASDEVVSEWAIKVFSSGNYHPDAVLYWIHEFWDMNLNLGVDYKRVRSIVIKTLCGDNI